MSGRVLACVARISALVNRLCTRYLGMGRRRALCGGGGLGRARRRWRGRRRYFGLLDLLRLWWEYGGGNLPSYNSDSETSLFELTSSIEAGKCSKPTTSLSNSIIPIRISGSERRIHIPSTTMRPSPRSPCNIREGSSKAKVQDHTNDAEESNASQTTHQYETEDRVQHRGA